MEEETEATVGPMVSTTKVFTFNVLLALLAESVTTMVQLEKDPLLRLLKVIVLLPLIAELLSEEQEPP